jgi:hypothetical protein
MGLHHIKPEKPPALHEEHPVFKPLCFLFFFCGSYEPDPGRKTNCKDVDPDPEKNPALFVSIFMPIKNNIFFSLSLSAYYLLS